MGEGLVELGRDQLRAGLAILAVAAYTPVRILLVSPHKFPHPERLALIVLAYWIVGLIWFAGLRRIGLRHNAALSSVLVFVLVASATGDLAYRHSTFVAILVVVGSAFATGLILIRLGEAVASLLVPAVIAFLCVTLLVVWLSNNWMSARSSVQEVESNLPAHLSEKPDIYVVVLDAFPGMRALDEVYEATVPLKHRRDVLRIDAWSSYPTTMASLASLLEMGYPLGDGAILNRQTARDLARILSGSNTVNEFLQEEGYATTRLESGYSHSWCGEGVDTCVSSPFLDEGTFFVLRESVLGVELMRQRGSPFTQGGLGAMDWMLSNLPLLARNSKADFFFGSVLVPHPPLMLDQNCQVNYDYWRVGNSLYAGSAFVRQRQRAFIDQANCVAQFEDSLFEAVPDDAIMIVMSDHGGDSLGQLAKYEHQWSETETVERLNSHLSLRGGSLCPLEEPAFIPEVMELLIWCLGGQRRPSADEPRQMFTMSRIGEPNIFELATVDESLAGALAGISGQP